MYVLVLFVYVYVVRVCVLCACMRACERLGEYSYVCIILPITNFTGILLL